MIHLVVGVVVFLDWCKAHELDLPQDIELLSPKHLTLPERLESQVYIHVNTHCIIDNINQVTIELTTADVMSLKLLNSNFIPL